MSCKKISDLRSGGVAQVIGQLLCIPKALSSNPGSTKKRFQIYLSVDYIC
jgi:hypothetical protein